MLRPRERGALRAEGARRLEERHRDELADATTHATANGTATAGSDYTAKSGTLTFSPGQISKTISVAVAGDTTPEVNETFHVKLSGAANTTILDGSGKGTITNDD